MKVKKSFFILLVFLLSISLIAGCSRGENTEIGQATEKEKTIIMGASCPLTGWGSTEGRLFEQAYRFWQEHVNANGGIKVGQENYKVELILYDDKSDAQTAAKLTEKLITEDKVDFLLSPYSSTLTFATSAIAEKYKVININPLGNAENLYTRGYKYLFGLAPPAAVNIGTLVEMPIENNYDIKNIVIVTPDDMYPLAAADAAKIKADELGLEVLSFIKYPKDATDLSTVVSQIRALHPDAVIATPQLESAMNLTKNMYEQQLEAKMIAIPDVVAMPLYVSNMGKAAEQIFSSTWWVKEIGYKDKLFGDTIQFAKMWEDKYGVEPASFYPAAAVAGAEVLQLAIEKAGTLDTEMVREALLEIEVETVFMPVKFGDVGELEQINVAGQAVLLQVQDGQPKVVYPQHLKQAEPIYPMNIW